MSVAVDERPPFRQHAQCAWCAEFFEIKAPMQRFCSDPCRYRARDAGNAASPAFRARVRERGAKWAAEHRGVKRREPWLLGQPIYESFLPGGFLEMSLNEPLRWPIEHRNVRGLHGAITAITGAHHPTVPRFALVPWHRGILWGLQTFEPAMLDVLAGTRHRVRIYDQERELRFGGRIRLKAPQVAKRGRRRLRIDAVTPVVVRNACNNHRAYRTVTGPNMLNTLCAWLPRRIGLELGEDDARMELVESDTRAEGVDVGAKYGRVIGWVGSVVVECNAVAEWLLRVAEIGGYGGRVAFGFGRVKVSPC